MTSNYHGWADKVAAEIAAERRPAETAPDTETMRMAAIRREAARRGAADDTVFTILRSLITVNADGDLVEQGTGKPLDAFMDDLEKTNPAYFGKAADRSNPGKDSPQNDVKNPFVKGPFYSVTQQMLLMKSDPEKAEFFQYQASIGRA